MTHAHHPTTKRAKGRDSDLLPRHDAPGRRTRRDRGLQDMSQDALAQLTSILIMPPDEVIAYPSEEWLKDQKERIKMADWPLRRQYSLAAKIAVLGRSLHVPSRTGRAELCTSHAQFDPRVIHDLRCLVARLCGHHLKRLRDNYHGKPHHPDVVNWLDRLECIRSVCLDENGINEEAAMDDEATEEDSWWSSRPAGTLGGSLKKVRSSRVVKKKIKNLLGNNVPRKKTCAACICAAVGGDRSMLADLFAGFLAREKVQEATGGKKRHRNTLLRVLECWTNHYDQGRQTRIQNDSTHLKPLVVEAYKQREKDSQRSRRAKSPSFRPRRDDLVSEPTLRHPPERPVAELAEDHLDAAVSRSSWDVPVYLAPHVEDYISSGEEYPETSMQMDPLQGHRTYRGSDGCISSEEEYPEILQMDPLQEYRTYATTDDYVSSEEEYHETLREDLLRGHRAHVEDYAYLEEEFIEIMHTDSLQNQRTGTDTLDPIDMRESAVPSPLNIDIPNDKTRPMVQSEGTREQSWATITVHTEQPSDAGFFPRNRSPPPPLPIRSAKRPSIRPVSSTYDSDEENPSPCPSVATSRLPFAPAARMKSMVDYNPKHLNQKALRALEGRASIYTEGDAFLQALRR